MILDKNGKLFSLFSLLDIAVILFLIFAVGAAVYNHNMDRAVEDTLLFTLTAEDVSEDTAKTLSAYEGVFLDSDGNEYTVRKTGVMKENVTLVYPSEDPTATQAPSDAPTIAPIEEAIPNSFSLTLYLSSKGEETDTFYLKEDGTPISLGETLFLEGAGSRIRMTVKAIDKE